MGKKWWMGFLMGTAVVHSSYGTAAILERWSGLGVCAGLALWWLLLLWLVFHWAFKIEPTPH